ncbi:hypothetical protein U1872_18345 [Sphingomonas sp. RB3P16]
MNEDPVEVSDAERIAEYQATDGDLVDPDVEANMRAIERRGLDI